MAARKTATTTTTTTAPRAKRISKIDLVLNNAAQHAAELATVNFTTDLPVVAASDPDDRAVAIIAPIDQSIATIAPIQSDLGNISHGGNDDTADAATHTRHVKNASRAKLAQFYVVLAAKNAASIADGVTHNKWGDLLLPRIADVATAFLNSYRTTGKIPVDLDTPVIRVLLNNVNNAAHHAKCIVAAGIIDSTSIPMACLWDAARKIPFFALPDAWQMMIYGDVAPGIKPFDHQLASDYIARIDPAFITDRAFGFTRNNRNNGSVLRAFWRCYLDTSRLVESTPNNVDNAYRAAIATISI